MNQSINKRKVTKTNDSVKQRTNETSIPQHKPLNSTVGLTLKLPSWPVSTLFFSVLPTLLAIATGSLSSRWSTLTTTRKRTLMLPLLKATNTIHQSEARIDDFIKVAHTLWQMLHGGHEAGYVAVTILLVWHACFCENVLLRPQLFFLATEPFHRKKTYCPRTDMLREIQLV